jgi:RNA polymerase sigma-70 factor (ECF subfamily)
MDDDVRIDAPVDEASFERLYRATVAHVHTLARRLAGPADAADAVQEVYVRAWTKRASYRGEGDVRGWLHRLALRALLNRRRARGRSLDFDLLPESSAAEAPPADGDARLDLETALGRLPSGARTIFVLHDVEGLAHGEIAALLGVSAGTSKSQLHRARMLLRGILDRSPEGNHHVTR